MDTRTELSEVTKKLDRLKKIGNRLEDLNREIIGLEGKISFLVKQVDKESEDIEVLKKTGIKSLFYKVLGSKEEQLEKERQEYLEANLRYDEVRKSLELLSYERNILEDKIKYLPKTERRYQELLKLREEEILSSNPKLANKINTIDAQITEREKMIFEVDEAMMIGQDAAQLLNQVLDKLNKAINWGQWDMTGRRGQMSSHMKHRQIDQAKNLAYKAKISLTQFEKELRDIYGPEDFGLTVRIPSFSSFTDIFFDNLITDWIVQQKIQNTRSGVVGIRDKTQRLLSTLKGILPKIESEIIQLEEARKTVLKNI
jgi:Chromosome segregation ATPases